MTGLRSNPLWERLQNCAIWRECEGLEREAVRLARSGQNQAEKQMRSAITAKAGKVICMAGL